MRWSFGWGSSPVRSGPWSPLIPPQVRATLVTCVLPSSSGCCRLTAVRSLARSHFCATG